MKKNSTLSNSEKNLKKEPELLLNQGISDEMTNKLSFYLEYIERNSVQVSKQTVQNIFNFSRSFRVLKTKSTRNIELNLN